MTPILEYYARKYNLVMSEHRYPYKLPRLAQYDSIDKDWYCEYYVYDATLGNLRRKRVVLNQATKAERLRAYKQAAEIITEILKAGNIMNPPKAPKRMAPISLVSEAMAYFLIFHKAIIKPSTIKSYTTQINRLEQYLKYIQNPHATLSQITEDTALQFADYLTTHQRIGNRTRNNNINTLITVFNFLKKRKLTAINPFEGIGMLPTVARSHTAFMPTEAQLFKDHCQHDPQLWLFCQFIYYVFVRPREELRHLKVGDISDNTIVINYGTAKNRKTEHIMIPTALQKIIDTHQIRKYPPQYYVFGKNGSPSDTPTYYHQLYRRHATVLKQCGLLGRNIDMYSWKHTGVIALWKATQNIQLIREQCRHSDLISTMKYLRDLGLFTDYEQINKFPEI